MTDTAADTYVLRFPQVDNDAISQDAERVEVDLDGSWQEIRFHDYEQIFALPGLYEQLFYDVLECESPSVVVEALAQHAVESDGLRVLDVGAGNGMVGERLRELGAEHVVGVDILESAAEATERDRPGVYDEYVVADLTDLPADAGATLAEGRFNALTCVAALGFGDMPPDAFAVAFNHVADDGLVALTIKEDFLDGADESGFAGFVGRLVRAGALEILGRRRYRHRLSVTGEELHYVVVVAAKRRDAELRLSER